MDAALLLAALASRAGDRVDLLAFDRAVRARVEGASPARRCCSSLVTAMAPLEPPLVETDWALRRAHGARPADAAARSSCCSPRSTRRAVEEGLLPVLGPLARRHTVVLASVADPEVASGQPRAATRRGGLRRRSRRAGPLRAPPGRRGCCARRGVEVVDAPPDDLAPRRSPTATSRSRPPAGSERRAIPERAACAPRPPREPWTALSRADPSSSPSRSMAVLRARLIASIASSTVPSSTSSTSRRRRSPGRRRASTAPSGASPPR